MCDNVASPFVESWISQTQMARVMEFKAVNFELSVDHIDRRGGWFDNYRHKP